MLESTSSLLTKEPESPAPATIETTLYELIEAISAEVEPGEEDLVTATVVHLLHSGRVRYTGDWQDITSDDF